MGEEEWEIEGMEKGTKNRRANRTGSTKDRTGNANEKLL
jgi:hypothetical protein